MLGERLKGLRKKRGLTQQDIADRLHITRSAYAQYEIDRRIPEFGTLEKLATFFEVSIDYLAGRTEDKQVVLSDESRKLIDMLDLSDEDIMERMDFVVDGIKLDPEDIKIFLALVRSERLRKKQGLVSEQNNS